MALGNLRSIGPVTVDYRNPALTWTSQPSGHGIRPCAISGTIEMAAAHQLSELVANPATQVTVGGFTGVLEYVEFDGDAVGPFTGYYLLESFSIDIDYQFVFADRSPFTLSAAFLGDLAP